MANPFEDVPLSPDAPAIGAKAISYGGGNQDLSDRRVRGIYIGTAGNLVVDFVDQKSASLQVTLTFLTAGVVYPFSISKVYQAGSTAAGVVLY